MRWGGAEAHRVSGLVRKMCVYLCAVLISYSMMRSAHASLSSRYFNRPCRPLGDAWPGGWADGRGLGAGGMGVGVGRGLVMIFGEVFVRGLGQGIDKERNLVTIYFF